MFEKMFANYRGIYFIIFFYAFGILYFIFSCSVDLRAPIRLLLVVEEKSKKRKFTPESLWFPSSCCFVFVEFTIATVINVRLKQTTCKITFSWLWTKFFSKIFESNIKRIFKILYFRLCLFTGLGILKFHFFSLSNWTIISDLLFPL